MSESNNSRLETFCDGVFAIALTLLIIDIKIPPAESIKSTNDLWLALRHIVPSMLSFILSFMVILITWVNHHACLRLVHRSSASFIYGNGFLLLTVVIIPFPTALLGEYLFTGHSAPAVVLYNAVVAANSIGWVLLTRAAIKNDLTKNEKSKATMRVNNKNGYYAFLIYTLLAIAAFWFPLTVATLTTLTWIFWLIFGINMKVEEA
jgi:uncharacterized membrane protein